MATSASAAEAPTTAHRFRLVDSAAVMAELEGPVGTVPLVEEVDAGTTDVAGMASEVEARAAGIASLRGPAVSTATARLRPESLSRFKRCSSARISDACW